MIRAVRMTGDQQVARTGANNVDYGGHCGRYEVGRLGVQYYVAPDV